MNWSRLAGFGAPAERGEPHGEARSGSCAAEAECRAAIARQVGLPMRGPELPGWTGEVPSTADDATRLFSSAIVLGRARPLGHVAGELEQAEWSAPRGERIHGGQELVAVIRARVFGCVRSTVGACAVKQVAPRVRATTRSARRQLELFFRGEARPPKHAVVLRLLERHHGHGETFGMGSVEQSCRHLMRQAAAGALTALVVAERDLGSIQPERSHAGLLVSPLQAKVFGFTRGAHRQAIAEVCGSDRSEERRVGKECRSWW